MNNIIIATSTFLVIASLAGTSVQAAPVSVDMNAAGLLGSPVAQIPIQDPTLQKAIEWIQSKQLKHEQREKTTPQSTIGERPSNDASRRLILGGPEVIPM